MASPFTVVSPLNAKLLQDYISTRDLDSSDFPGGLFPFSKPELLTERGYNAMLAAGRPFVFLDYLNSEGKLYYEPWDEPTETHTGNPYALARFLGEVNVWRGAEPPPKVIAQNHRANVLHYEPIRSGERWANLPEGTMVLHLESMIKAKSVHKATGIPCIGLNGVSSWSSAKRGVRFIYEDELNIDFSKFFNVILFDSNVWKKDVANARDRLLFHFKHTLGCKHVGYIDLPKREDGEDWGPDDYIHANLDLKPLIEKASEYRGGEHDDLVNRMNLVAVYCRMGGTIIDRRDKVNRDMPKARSLYANVWDKVLVGKSIRTIKGLDVFLESIHREEVINPAYEYLGDEYLEGRQYYNSYVKSGTWPKDTDPRGNIGPFLKHLDSIMSPYNVQMIRSYAKHLKFTGNKTTSGPVIYSDDPGLGKGWICKWMERLIGETNVTNADAQRFVSNFNDQVTNKRLVVINEYKVTGQPAKDASINSMKRFYGDEKMPAEKKGIDSYQVKNKAGLIITSNFLEDVPTDGLSGRRIWYVECHRPDYEPNWRELQSMIDRPEIMNAIYDWVEGAEEIDFSTWKPPLDEERTKAVRRSSSSLEDGCFEALDYARELGLVVASYETIKEVLRRADPKAEFISPRTISSALVRSGWLKTATRYGPTPNDQRYMYACNVELFYEIERDKPAVWNEVKRSTIVWIGGGLNKMDA